MCGIAGAIERGRNAAPAVLAERGWAMAGCLLHRGPDDGGVWTDERAGLILAHRRLSIIDLSPTGHQPMVSACGRWVLVYNGEIYNFAELRRDLVSRGRRLRGASDTEVLLELIAADGLRAALQRCRGMFALALHDRDRGTVSLARDRFGEKPLYYGWSRGTFLFASECTAMRTHPDFDDAIDADAVAALLQNSFVPAPLAIFRGATKLLPGCIVEVHANRPGEVVGPTAYWSLSDVASLGQQDPLEGSAEELTHLLEATLSDAVAEAMVADVPLGAFLSGGVDSSTIVALMQTHSATPIRTYTVGFEDPDYDEASWAAAVAAHLGTDHTELHVTSAEARAVIPDLPTMYDEPFADASQIPTALVSRLARRDVTVVLSGDGGDELFGGYGRYAVADQRWRRVAPVPLTVRRVAARLAATAQRGRRLSHMLRAERPEELYDVLLTHWLDPEAVVLGVSRRAARGLTDSSVELVDPVTRFMLRDAQQYLPDAVLVKVDRAAMSTGLETRVPMLDPRVAELAWRLPLELRSGGPGRADKVVLRHVLSQHVPRSLTERPKMGFGVPIEAWLRGPLRNWAEDVLSEQTLRRQGLLDPAAVREAWRDHLSGRRNAAPDLWSVLMLGTWLDGSPPLTATVAGTAGTTQQSAQAGSVDGGAGDA